MFLASQISTNDLDCGIVHSEKYWHNMQKFMKKVAWKYYIVYQIKDGKLNVITQHIPNPIFIGDKIQKSPAMDNLAFFTFQKL